MEDASTDHFYFIIIHWFDKLSYNYLKHTQFIQCYSFNFVGLWVWNWVHEIKQYATLMQLLTEKLLFIWSVIFEQGQGSPLCLLPLLWNCQEPWEHFCLCAVHTDFWVKLTAFSEAQMVVLAASISGDYQDTFTALVLRRAACTEWAMAEGGGEDRCRELLPLYLVPSPLSWHSSPLLSTGDLLAACQLLRAIFQCWSLPHMELQELGEERVEKLLILVRKVWWKGARSLENWSKVSGLWFLSMPLVPSV